MFLSKEEKQIIKIIRYVPILLLLILSVFITTIVIIQSKQNFKNEIENLKQFYYQHQKNVIKDDVDRVFTRVYNQKQRSQQLLKKSLKEKIDNAYNIIENIYSTYKDTKSKDEIMELMNDALRPIKFYNGLGYYFIYTLDGTVLMHGATPELEGKNLWNHRDSRGTPMVQQMHDILKTTSLAYYKWYWKKPEDNKEYEKLGYFRVFEPYGFFIGTGHYVKDFEDSVKKNLLDDISKISQRDGNGYIFVVDYNGMFLSHVDPNFVGKNMLNLKDENGNKIIQNIVDLGKSSSGKFLSYSGIKKPTTGEISYKTSYLRGFDEWEWIIGTGFYNDSLNTMIEKRRVELNQSNKENITLILVISFVLTLILLLLSIQMSNIIKNKFDVYRENVDSEIEKNNTQNKQLQEQIKQSQEYEKVINSSNMVSITDVRGTILYVNEEFCKITGYSKEDLVGKNHNILRNKNTPIEFYKKMWEEILSGKVWRGVSNNITKDGKNIYLNTTISPIFDSEGNIKKFIATRFDITAKVNSEIELKNKDNILAQQSKMAAMGEMIGAIAHQWRQPLSLISTASSGVKMQKEFGLLTDELLSESMDAINHSVQHLSQTIDDFRNFFNPTKSLSSFTIKESFEKTFKLVDAQFSNNHIEVVKNIANISVYGLENELLQVLINILNNAKDQLIDCDIDEKVVIVEAKEILDELFISICDNGGGIDEDIIENIFESYFTTKEDIGGTGIGLYMSKHIIEKNMKGTLEVVNDSFIHNATTYKGAKFIIKIPIS